MRRYQLRHVCSQKPAKLKDSKSIGICLKQLGVVDVERYDHVRAV